MQILRKLNRSRIAALLLLTAVFVVMLVGNFLTDKVSDDFMYSYSFATGEPIQSFGDLMASMKVHAVTMNGRLLAHSLVQIFETLPKPVFNVVNALMFTLSIYLMYKLCMGKQKSNLFLLTVFSAVWVLEPGFGQVNFWLDGACNYLWAQIPAFLFLIPFVKLYRQDKNILTDGAIPLRILFILGAIPMGAFLENMSGTAIFMGILLLLLVRFENKVQVPWAAIAAVIAGMVGYAIMILTPAERGNKSGGFSPIRLLYQFGKVMHRFYLMKLILIAFVILLFAAVAVHADRKRILLSGVFALGGFGAGMIFVLSAYYPVRCMATPALLFLMAGGVLLTALLDTDKLRMPALCLMTILCMSLLYWCPAGIQDIYLVREQIAENRETILTAKAEGITELRLPVPVPETQYPAVYQLVYLSEDDPEQFSSKGMAKYYGMDSILAEPTE